MLFSIGSRISKRKQLLEGLDHLQGSYSSYSLHFFFQFASILIRYVCELKRDIQVNYAEP